MLDKFLYVHPNSKEELFLAMQQYGMRKTCMLAGGTDLIPALRSGKKHAECIIDLEGLGINDIKLQSDCIHIGALVTFRSLLRNDIIKEYIPILAQAAAKIGAVQTQSLATIGGNLCNGLPSADSAPPLLVLDAKLRLLSAGKERLVEVGEFFTGPGFTVISNEEVLAEIIIPKVRQRRANFIKIGRRKGMSLAVLNGAASFSLNADGFIENARIALGAAGPTPIRAVRAEEFISGRKPSAELFEQAGKIASAELKPRSSIRGSAEYRLLLSEVLVKRNLEETYFDSCRKDKTIWLQLN